MNRWSTYHIFNGYVCLITHFVLSNRNTSAKKLGNSPEKTTQDAKSPVSRGGELDKQKQGANFLGESLKTYLQRKHSTSYPAAETREPDKSKQFSKTLYFPLPQKN